MNVGSDFFFLKSNQLVVLCWNFWSLQNVVLCWNFWFLRKIDLFETMWGLGRRVSLGKWHPWKTVDSASKTARHYRSNDGYDWSAMAVLRFAMFQSINGISCSVWMGNSERMGNPGRIFSSVRLRASEEKILSWSEILSEFEFCQNLNPDRIVFRSAKLLLFLAPKMANLNTPNGDRS